MLRNFLLKLICISNLSLSTVLLSMISKLDFAFSDSIESLNTDRKMFNIKIGGMIKKTLRVI